VLHDSIIVLIRILQILGGITLMVLFVLLAQNNDHQVDIYLSFFSMTGIYIPTLTLPVWILILTTALLFYGMGLLTFWVYLWQKKVLKPYLKTLLVQK
jgi:hypothetical protein